jgi:predicted ATPase/class 3 adenylate cyclase
MRTELPAGTVTFLFTDVEGSTRLLDELGAAVYADALAAHRQTIRKACARHDGVEVDTQGDAFFFAFPTAEGALAAAGEMTRDLAPGPIRVRIGLHTGTPLLAEEGYVGGDVHRAARIAAVGHGGQVLVSATTAQLVEVELADLGEHRLKDLSAHERIYQLGEGTFPPLKSLFRTNLPIPATPFLGRERELAEVVGLLAGTRLLTLTGPGGTGKTRLAAQAAGMSAEAFPEGVWWVPLETLRDPTLVVEAIAQALGAKQELDAHIGDQQMLILLDCFEGVVRAAGDVANLLASSPNLKLLVTSRERLNLTGEQEYPVPAFAHEEAVGFFSARARTVKPDFTADDAVAEICLRLDDMPLALELAAVQVKVLSPQQILERGLGLSTLGPRDLPDRQRTLAATIEWSYELLSETEQLLFRRLSVFAGGATLEAAEEVADADLETLQALVDKSLIRRADERFRMLDTIRDYASERLAESGEADILHERLARQLIVLAGAEGAPQFRERQATAFARLEPEHANTRSVMDWALRQDRYELAAEVTGLLRDVWLARGHVIEARGWVTAVLQGRGSIPGRLWAEVFIAASDVMKLSNDLQTATEVAEELIELATDDSNVDQLYVAAALADLSDIAREQGDVARAHEYAERTLAFRRARGLPGGRAFSSLGELALEEGDLERAGRLFEAAARDYAGFGHDLNYVGAIKGRGEVARQQGDLDRAIELFAEALNRSLELGDQAGVGDCLQDLALVASDRGQEERAARLWGAGQALREAAGVWGVPYGRRHVEPELPSDAKAAGAAMSIDEAVAYAREDADA